MRLCSNCFCLYQQKNPDHLEQDYNGQKMGESQKLSEFIDFKAPLPLADLGQGERCSRQPYFACEATSPDCPDWTRHDYHGFVGGFENIDKCTIRDEEVI